MAASYPTSAKTFTIKNNATDIADASHINDIQSEVTAVETDLLSSTPTYITNVITGINAAAISTGILPDARLSGSYTNVTALTSSNGTFTNVLTINAAVITGNLTANGANGSSGQVLTTNGSGLYWSTVSGGGGGGETSNSTGGSGSIQYYNGTTFGSSSNLVFTGTTVFVGNSTSNGVYGQQSLTLANNTSSATLNAGTLVLGTGSINSTSYTGTANNSTYAFGKSENQLNVNSATQATNATNLNSQPASYYTNASNLNTGTVAIARLDANVILTTSTTGINASALSTGTVPDARLSGSYTGVTALTVSNTVSMGRVIESFQTYSTTISGAPTITFDCTTGNIWNVTNTISSNWTANFTNLGLTNSHSTSVTLVVNQGVTGYLPSAVQVEGNATTINWQAGTPPTPNANKKDIFGFSILQTGASTYLVLGQLVSFG